MGEKLNVIIKDSAYKLTQFTQKSIDELEDKVFLKKDKPYIKCMVRQKDIKLTPEEVVRQLYIYKLVNEYNYPVERMELERVIHFGREKKRADIVIFNKEHNTSEEIIVELKKPKLKDGKEQLKSYCNATGAIIGVWTNGDQISYYHRKDPNYFEDIPNNFILLFILFITLWLYIFLDISLFFIIGFPSYTSIFVILFSNIT